MTNAHGDSQVTDIDVNDGAFNSDPLARLFAGGRHVRMLLLGAPPEGMRVPPTTGFERVARVDVVPWQGSVVADPQRLPFNEALFDRALVCRTWEPDAAAAELRELWRVLAPAGIAVVCVAARRGWEVGIEGWRRKHLRAALEDAMFEVLAWDVESLPARHHLALIAKRDGLRPALIGRVEEGFVPAMASGN